MKRLAVFILALVIACGTFTFSACSSDDTIRFYAYQPKEQADLEAYKELINAFSEETGIKVKPIFVQKDQYNTALNTALKGKEKPDVAYLDQPLLADKLSGLVNLTDMIASSETISADDFFQSGLDTVTFNQDQYYGVPLTMTTTVLFYNKDKVSTAPATWAEWRSLMEGLPTTSTAMLEGVGAGGYASWYFQAFLANAGGTLTEGDEVTFQSEAGQAAAKMMRDLYLKSPKSIRDGQNAFGTGSAYFKLGSSSDIDSLDNGFTINYGVVKMPYDDSKIDKSWSNIGGENLVVFDATKRADDCMKLIEFLLKEENLALIAKWTGNFPAIEEFASAGGNEKKAVVLDQLKTAQARPVKAKWIQVNDDFLAPALANILDVESKPKANATDDEAITYIKEQLEAAAASASSILGS